MLVLDAVRSRLPSAAVHAAASAAALAAVLGLAALPAAAGEPSDVRLGNVRFVSGQELRVSPDEPAAGDVYAAVVRARIDGQVPGDFVVAGSDVGVNGTIERDLDAVALQIEVRGTVGSRLRASARTTSIAGTVGADTLVLGWRAHFERGSTVHGALAVRAADVRLDGTVHGPVWVSGGRVTISGRLAQDVTVDCDELLVQPGARITGNLLYQAREAARMPAGAVEGTVTRTLQSPDPPDSLRGAPLLFDDPRMRLGFDLYFAGVALASGLLVALFFRPLLDGALARAETGAGLAFSFGVGLVALLALVVVGALCCLALPLALAVLCGLAALGYLGTLVGKMIVGTLLLRPMRGEAPHPVLALVLGIAAVAAVGWIPYLGGLLWFCVMVTGMGAVMLQIREGGPPGTEAVNPAARAGPPVPAAGGPPTPAA